MYSNSSIAWWCDTFDRIWPFYDFLASYQRLIFRNLIIKRLKIKDKLKLLNTNFLKISQSRLLEKSGSVNSSDINSFLSMKRFIVQGLKSLSLKKLIDYYNL